jgi:hypothetical protein
MKKICLIFLISIMGLPIFAQRLAVETYGSLPNYKKHYSHIIDAANIDGNMQVIIAGNRTDKGTENEDLTGHKISGSNLIVSKWVNPFGQDNNLLLTDFTIHPSEEFQYGVGTGIYYPSGADNSGYPFIGLYNKATLQIDYFYYFNLSYADFEPSHATGLRVKYSRIERAYYICGALTDRRFYDININDITAKSKGFILKVPEDGNLNYTALIFSPNAIDKQAEICVISDIAINEDETKIAFTGLNTSEDLDAYHHPMTGVIDMNLGVDWCKVYEIDNVTYGGVDVLFNEADNNLFVLHNSTGNDFSIMELSESAGVVQQGPVAYRCSDAATLDETTRAHMMHLVNDELIITGNIFAEKALGGAGDEWEFLYQFDVDASNLQNNLSDFIYYSDEPVPPGNQKAVYSYWAPENSVYINGNLNLVGVCNNSPIFGFTHVNLASLSDACKIPLDVDSRLPVLDDIINWTTTSETCNAFDPTVSNGTFYPVYHIDCLGKSGSMANVNDINDSYEMWKIERISKDGVDVLLNSEKVGNYKISVFDIMGREVYSSEFNTVAGETSVKLDFDVRPEMYIIRINNGTTSDTKKFINLDIR